MLPGTGRRTAPTVFIVDDDISVRESLESLVSCVGWHAQTFATAADFLARRQLDASSCLILDVALPDANGLDLLKRIAVDQKIVPVILLTGYGDIPMAVEAMKSGAFEFLTKPFSADVLLSAIERAIERSEIELVQEAERRALDGRHASLSQREREVMSLVVSGRLNKEIGFELGISEITVKAHRGKVMRKMRADSLADLIKMSVRLPRPSVHTARVT